MVGSIHSDINSLEHEVVPLVERDGYNLFMGCVVVLNILCIGLSVDLTDAKAHNVLDIMSKIFSAIYCIDTSMRTYTHGIKYFRSPFNCFDTVLVVIALIDAWVAPYMSGKSSAIFKLSFLRIFRILRLAKLVRVAKNFKELWLVLQGFSKSLRLLVWLTLLIFTGLYALSILTLPILSTIPQAYNLDGSLFNFDEYFGNFVYKTTFTYFQVVVGKSSDAINSVIRPLLSAQPAWIVLFICLTFLVRFGILNMVLGVIVSNVFAVANDHSEAVEAKRRSDELKLINSLRKFFTEIDSDNSGSISRDELRAAFSNAEIFKAFKALKLPSIDPDVLFTLMDSDGSGSIMFEEFIVAIVRLKKRVKGADFVKLKLALKNQDDQLATSRKRLERVSHKIKDIGWKFSGIHDALERLAELSKDPLVQMRREGKILPDTILS